MADPTVKYFNHPTFKQSEWESRNPLLEIGEVGFVLDNSGAPTYPLWFKVGPGRWNDLPYFETGIWTDTTNIKNPIGDATGNLSGKSPQEILNLMLNPYQTPVVSNQQNNAGGTFATTWTREIGTTVTGPVLVNYSVSNSSNLTGATPINITAQGVFSNEGNFANGQVSLSLSSPLTPSSITTVSISIKATHTKGTTSPVYTYIRFYPKILWGISQSSSIQPSEWVNLSSYNTLVTSSYLRDYTFNGTGYSYLAIPSMLSPGTLVFTDVTDPNAPAGYGMNSLGQQTINNGVTSYAYQTYRSTYYLTTSSILRVTNAT